MKWQIVLLHFLLTILIDVIMLFQGWLVASSCSSNHQHQHDSAANKRGSNATGNPTITDISAPVKNKANCAGSVWDTNWWRKWGRYVRHMPRGHELNKYCRHAGMWSPIPFTRKICITLIEAFYGTYSKTRGEKPSHVSVGEISIFSSTFDLSRLREWIRNKWDGFCELNLFFF